MYVCICRGITEADVRRAGRAGITAPADLIAVLGLDDDRCCGRCAAHVEDFVALAWEGAAEMRAAPAGGSQPEPPARCPGAGAVPAVPQCPIDARMIPAWGRASLRKRRA